MTSPFGDSKTAPAVSTSLTGLVDRGLSEQGFLSSVFYQTADGHIHASFMNKNPVDIDLTLKGPGSIVGGSLASMVDSNADDVFYISPDQHVHLLSLTPGQLPTTGTTDRDITLKGPVAIP